MLCVTDRSVETESWSGLTGDTEEANSLFTPNA